MSTTYHLACDQCHQYLWIGQRGSGLTIAAGGYIYSGSPKVMQALSDFLYGHIDHPLRFVDDSIFGEDGWEEVKVDESEEGGNDAN